VKAEERKRQILEAAEACFTVQGFHQTTMDDIARKAGISPALIYRYFTSKEELIEAMIGMNSAPRQWFICELLRFPTINEALEFFFEVLFRSRVAAQSVPLLAQLSAEAFRNDSIAELLRKDNAVFFGGFAQMIRQAQSRGQIDPEIPAADAAYMLLSFANGLVSQIALDGAWDRLQDPAFIRLFRRMFSCFLHSNFLDRKNEEDS
jgi:TetR/AcrR family transcriptional repressor of uid operon